KAGGQRAFGVEVAVNGAIVVPVIQHALVYRLVVKSPAFGPEEIAVLGLHGVAAGGVYTVLAAQQRVVGKEYFAQLRAVALAAVPQLGLGAGTGLVQHFGHKAVLVEDAAVRAVVAALGKALHDLQLCGHVSQPAVVLVPAIAGFGGEHRVVDIAQLIAGFGGAIAAVLVTHGNGGVKTQGAEEQAGLGG